MNVNCFEAIQYPCSKNFENFSKYDHHYHQHRLVEGSICEDMDECLEENGGCAQICTNTPGSRSSSSSSSPSSSSGLICSDSEIILADEYAQQY